MDSKSHTDGEREEEEEEEPEPTDEYEDDGFELDQTTAGGVELASLASYPERDHSDVNASKSDSEAPFASQFDRMKVGYCGGRVVSPPVRLREARGLRRACVL